MLGRYDRLERMALASLVTLSLAAVVAVVVEQPVVLAIAASGTVLLFGAMGVEVRRKVRLDHAATRFHVGEAVRESTAAAQLVSLIDARAPLPSMGDWAMQPSALVTMYHLVRRHRPDLVVELGSGSSTVILGHAVQAYGGRILSVEHDERFAEATRQALDAHGLTDTCSVAVAPLVDVEVEGVTRRWYDPAVFDGLEGIGVLVVDGPPELTGPQARFPAVPWLRDRLAHGAYVVLDDVHREDERRILAAWDARFPELERVESIGPRVGIRRLGG
jgi:hypothetical protein